MPRIHPWLHVHRHLLSQVQEHACRQRVRLYIVGGCLRDLLLPGPRSTCGLTVKIDIDFCLARHAISFGRGLAARLKAGFVVLDEVNKCSRVVIKRGGQLITLDFADFRGPSLEADLRLRDFTVNSLALPLGEALAAPDSDSLLIDPCNGRLDIRARRLRLCYPQAFVDDPLRILRTFSLSAACGFSADTRTLAAVKKHVRRLADVSGERVRDELFKLFASRQAFVQLKEMDRRGVLVQVLPELAGLKRLKRSGRHAFDMWKHTLDTVGCLEKLLPALCRDKAVETYLNTQVSGGRSRLALLKLAALLHDAGKPETFALRKGKVTFYGHERVGSRMVIAAAERLKLSTIEVRSLRRLTFMHLRPGYLASVAHVSARARFRFFRDAADDALALIVLALADQRATRGYAALEPIRGRYERLMRSLIREYVDRQKQEAPVRLVNGDDLMKHFSLEPGPLLGKILVQLEEQQALGKISSKEQALVQAAGIIKRLSFR